jgi:folate-binding protein YgfZ
LLLQPQGKLIVDFHALHRKEDEWWCVCEGGFGTALAKGLGRFKIRVKVDIEPRRVAALAVRGQSPPDDACGTEIVSVPWNGVAAYDALGDEANVDALRAALALRVVDAFVYERARIVAGVPRLGADLDEKTIPQEAGLERDAVSFTKGCFLGQELVCRIDTRGHVNRYLRRLRGTALEVGADVSLDGKVVGSITSSAGDVALAMIRREVDPGSTVTTGADTALVEATAAG